MTDYRKRVALLKSGLPRVVVRKSNRAITMQVVAYEPNGDKILASASSRELKQFGWEPRANIPTAYLTGMLLAKKAKGMKDKRLILDIGLYRPVKSSVVFAAAKGTQEGGINISANIDFSAERLSGSHIAAFAAKKEAQGSKVQFSDYGKSGFDPARIREKFEEAKKKISG